jgi:hypothetical protein
MERLPVPFFIFAFAVSFLAALPFLNAEAGFDHSLWDGILKRSVHEGLVDYNSLRNENKSLDRYFKQIDLVTVDQMAEWTREERIAFWVNLYNAGSVRLILEENPKERFDEIPAAFEIRRIRVIGEFFSLSEIRDEILRKHFRDERILTALVSGRMDSPKLLDEAFRSDVLEEQLNRAAHTFVEDSIRNQIVPAEKNIFLSPLFKDYGPDFLLNFGGPKTSRVFSETENAVVSFILFHLRDPEKRLFLNSAEYQINYLPRDDRINDIRFAGTLSLRAHGT